MVTTRRPVLPARGALAFAYVNGQFYFSNETHAEITSYLLHNGVARDQITAGEFGTIYNDSDDEVPNYVLEEGSDFEGYNPVATEVIDKLDALFPGITRSPTNDQYEARVAALQDLPASAPGPIPHLQELAQDYMENQGGGYNPPERYVPVDPVRSRQIAAEYEAAEHRPDDPRVKASYDAMKTETLAQYNHLVKNGYTFEFYPDHDPYPGGPHQALDDLRQNRHLYVFPTSGGFGSQEETESHPLLDDSGVQWKGKPVTYNDLFRAVHDVFGHGAEGVGFRANGEENAWRQHSSMYSQLARPAMTSETRGQNSWVNFGPYGEQNQMADQASTIYADQKATLLPDWVTNDGAHDHIASGWLSDEDPENDEPKYEIGQNVLWNGQPAFVTWQEQDEQGEWLYFIQSSDNEEDITDAREDELEPDNSLKDKIKQRIFDQGESRDDVQPIGWPKFERGDGITFKGYGDHGSVDSAWWSEKANEWEYEVTRYDSEGYVDKVHAYESDLERSSIGYDRGPAMDQPSAWTLKDFGIPPEGEEYFRNSYYLNSYQIFPKWKKAGIWTKKADSDTMGDMGGSVNLYDLVMADAAASTALTALTAAGGQVYVVGGAVRDSIMGGSPKDIDLMCQGLTPEQIQATLTPLGRLDFTGAAFGVFRFKRNGDDVEIALPRTERSTGSGHKDFEVNADPSLSAEDDLSRRDFTINAMAYHPLSGQLLDPHNGQDDVKNGRLALVNPQAFHDDPLRVVRALVATARYGFEPDPQLLTAMHDQAAAIRHLPGERIRMEMDKLLSSPDPVKAMQMAEQTGVLDYLAPELSSTVGFSQYNPHHDLDVWEHTMQVLKGAVNISNDPDVRLAALFHDSGKPDSFWQDANAPEGGGGHFYKKKNDDGSFVGQDHEEVGGDLVKAYMDRLRYPTKRIERVEFLVRNHMFPYFDTAKGARKFLKRCNGDPKLAFDLLALRQADASGKRTGQMNDFDTEKVTQARTLLQDVLNKDEPVSTKSLAIDGNDLIQLGMKPGPEIGQVLNRLLDEVMDNPDLNNREDLMRLVNT